MTLAGWGISPPAAFSTSVKRVSSGFAIGLSRATDDEDGLFAHPAPCVDAGRHVEPSAHDDAKRKWFRNPLGRRLSIALHRTSRRATAGPRGRDERGVAAVEFALLLPVLIMLLFGIIEFGLALSRQQVLDTASREGARLGIRQAVPRPTVADIQALARRVFTQAGVTGVTPTIAVSGAGGPSGTDLIVTVSAPYQFYVMANIIPALRGTVTLRSRTLMRHE